MAAESSTEPTKPEPSAAAELVGLVEKAKRGDPAALPRIREILDRHPEIWQRVGNVTTMAEQAWLAVLAAGNPLAVESLTRTVAEMRAELAGGPNTRLERMLVDQIILVWLEFSYVQAISANSGGDLAEQNGLLKRVESAQRRHASAVKLLTTVRSLMPAATAPVTTGPARTLRIYDPDRDAA